MKARYCSFSRSAFPLSHELVLYESIFAARTLEPQFSNDMNSTLAVGRCALDCSILRDRPILKQRLLSTSSSTLDINIIKLIGVSNLTVVIWTWNRDDRESKLQVGSTDARGPLFDSMITDREAF